MKFILNKQAIRLYYKFRHRRGHGIHSPFVFNFIENIVENKLPFYAFAEIADFVLAQPGKYQNNKKINQLLFRLVNHFQPKDVFVVGTKNGVNLIYISAPNSKINCVCLENSKENRLKASTLLHHWNRNVQFCDDFPQNNIIYDCIVIDLKIVNEPSKALEYALKHVNEKSVIVLNNIRTNPDVNSLVQGIKDNQDIRIFLDMYNVAVLILDKKYYKRNYKISF